MLIYKNQLSKGIYQNIIFKEKEGVFLLTLIRDGGGPNFTPCWFSLKVASVVDIIFFYRLTLL